MIQRQTGGDGSLNVQGADVSVHVHNEGLTASEVLDMILTLGRANLLEMQGAARRVVDERLEDFTNRFIAAVQERDPASLGAASDPDVQYSLLAAQRGFARSGEERLATTLVDLLVSRCGERNGSLRALALSAAIEVVGRLTDSQVDALTAFWASTRLRALATRNRGDLAAWLRANLVPFVSGIPVHDSVYDHLVYAGCAQIQISEITLGQVWGHAYPGLFARGFLSGEMPAELRGVSGVFTQALDSPDRLQVNALNEESVDEIADRAGVPDHAESLRVLLKNNILDAPEVESIVLRLVPELADFAEKWKSAPIKNLRLSSVGLVIAHSNWTRVVGPNTALSVWIPDDAEPGRAAARDLT